MTLIVLVALIYLSASFMRRKLNLDYQKIAILYAIVFAVGVLAGASPNIFPHFQALWMKLGVPAEDWKP